MAQDKDRKTLNVPPLRFTGFTDEWNPTPLNQMVKSVTRKNTGEESKVALTISAQYGLVDQESFFNNKVASSDLSHYYLLYKGDYAYNKSYSSGYPWGAVKRLNMFDKGAVSTLYICFRPFDIVDSDFIGHYFESTKWHKGVSEIAVEGARNHGLLNIGIKDFFDTVHFIPSLTEQRQIANLLSLIDERIATQNKIIDNLQSLIKGLIQHLTRVGLEKGTWHKVMLSEVLQERNEMNIEYYLVHSVSVSVGIVNQVEYLGRSFAAKDTSHYHVVRYGDIVYTKSPTGNQPYGIIKQSFCQNPVAVSPLYGVYDPISFEIGNILHYYFLNPLNTNNYLLPLIQKGAKNTINITNHRFLENSIPLPISNEEIIYVSKTLSSLNSKIELENRALNTLLKERQYLLNMLFI